MEVLDVILVDEHDNAIGVMPKLQAHLGGYLHRAFSIFIVNSHGNMLLQQRAFSKYHSAGLWTNACCSHPRLGEAIQVGALRRLEEEMGFKCELKKIFTFTYRSELDNGLIEHEIDHVFIGFYEGEVNPNRDEVFDHKYMPLGEIEMLIQQEPNSFTSWFIKAFPIVKLHLQ